MNNPQSDGNESVIDIFVLGRNETGTLELRDQLEQQDYRVTLFNDGPELIGTLYSGKPNLVICDTTSFGQDAYEYCRQIKSDDRLWMIPVMILTQASSLGDLLYVLDSNGDNFIAKPYDFPYLLSLIEGMLSTPVEPQTTDQIKTQFKIQHDDRIFVVTADRRKLLEFLLSAFEIAVKNSEDLSSAHAELQRLSSGLKTLESAGREHAQLIDVLNATVRRKEQDERSLREDLEETEQALDEKTAEVGQLSKDLGEGRILLTTAQEHVSLLLAEKEKTAATHQSEISLLNEHISSLSQELDAKKTELDAEKQVREEETTRMAKLDLALKESDSQKGHLETRLQALTCEKEQLASAISSEKSRAKSAEEETKSVLLAKAQSEEELRRFVDEHKEATRKRDDEILRLKADLEAASLQYSSMETRFENLRQEREQLQSTYEVNSDLQKRQFGDLQAQYDSTVSTVFAQERELHILRDELVVAQANREKAAVSAASIAAAFNETRVEIEEREWKIQSLEKQILDAATRNETGDEKTRALIASLESVQSALNEEKERHAASEERLTAEIRKRDETLQLIQDAHGKTKTDLEANNKKLVQLNRDFESAALLRSTLQGDITAASFRIKELEHELNAAVLDKDKTSQQVHSLSEELDHIKTTFEETRLALAGEKEQRQSFSDALDRIKTDLEAHKHDLLQRNRDLEAARSLRSTLQGDITTASSRIKELEHELNAAVQEKEKTGQQVRSLSEELECMKTTCQETRMALSGEKDQHAALKEQLNAALRERDETLHSVQGAHTQTKTDLEVHRNDLMRLNRDLEAATHLNSVLLADFNAASVRINELEHELNSVVFGKEQTGQQARSLSDDLEGTKAELETERRIRRTAEVNLQKSVQVNSRLEGDIARLIAEQEKVAETLEHEKRLHMAAVEKARAIMDAKDQIESELKSEKVERERLDTLRAVKIQELNQDREQVLARQRDLEQKVTTLESEKSAAEARANVLSDEIQQARIALADEWEHHMNDEERLAATEAKATALEQSLSGTGKVAFEQERTRAVIIRQADLPAEIRSSPQAIVVTPSQTAHAGPVPPSKPDKEPEVSPSLSIDDLFEDDSSDPAAADRLSGLPPHPDAESEAEIHDMIMKKNAAEESGASDVQEPDDEAGEHEEAGEDEGEPIKTFDDFVSTPSSYGISFNRRQWFDLLKWSHHSGALSQEQRMQIVRMGRLIQNGRKLTKKQDEQVREMIVLVQTLGYRFH